jgi:acyl carrier protein
MNAKEQRMPNPDLRDWLTERVAYYLGEAPDRIAVDVPLASYGMDSVYAFTICGDIEDRFGIAVEPTLAWDYPTIDAMTAYLNGLLG